MKKTLLLLALFAGSLLSANADDHLTAFLKPGDQVLGIQLKNATDYTAFEMEIELPEGMTVPTQTVDGKVVVADDAVTIASDRKSETAPHKAFAHLNGNKLKVVAFSASSYESGTPTNPIAITDGNKDFRKQKGDLVLINVIPLDGYNVSEIAASDIAISDAKFVKKVETEGTTKFVEDGLSATITGKFGDINGNNEVTTDDAVMAIKHFLKKSLLTPEQVEIGDLTGDLEVTTDDAVRIIKVFLKKF